MIIVAIPSGGLACSFAYACGVPIHLIKLQGYWVSEAYQQYLSVPLEMRWKCVRVIAEAR